MWVCVKSFDVTNTLELLHFSHQKNAILCRVTFSGNGRNERSIRQEAIPRNSTPWICFLFDASLQKQPRHDVHKACCFYCSRSCRVNPHRLTWPVNDIPTELKILFHPTKDKELGIGIWYEVMSFIHKMSPSAVVRRFLFILYFECCFITISCSLVNSSAEILQEHISALAQSQVCVPNAQMVWVCSSTHIGSSFPGHTFSFPGLGSVSGI